MIAQIEDLAKMCVRTETNSQAVINSFVRAIQRELERLLIQMEGLVTKTK